MAKASQAPFRRRFIIFLILNISISIGVIFFIPSCSTGPNEQPKDEPTPKRSRGFLVDTISCQITDMNPFDKTVMHIYKKTGDIKCSSHKSITYDEGPMLRFNRRAIAFYFGKRSIYCHYREIVRGRTNVEWSYAYKGKATLFHEDIRVNVDFIEVQCFNKSNKSNKSNNKSIYKNFHSFVVQRPSVEKRSDTNLKSHKQLHRPKEMLNVLLVGIDSVSRLNSMRHMPLTRHYLLNDLNAIELKGYTKVGDNTFPNMVPLTTGKHEEELPFDARARLNYLDKFGFIWKNFTKSGYRTLFAEDAPNMQMFHYGKRGFKVAPVDHYYRVFSVVLDKQSVWNTGSQCFGDRMEFEMVLNYTLKFESLYRNKPHFGFAFISRLTHNHLNYAGMADTPSLRFLQKLNTGGLLNNTVMLFFSDHGLRFGSIRSTYSGRLEERLPMSFLVVPKWFGAKYPGHMKNLRINSERLTSPFDIHETLIDMARFTGEIRPYRPGQRGISLFSEIPSNRTCDEAGIPEHWCVCLKREHISAKTTAANMSAKVVVQYINNIVSVEREKCAVLRVHEVRDVLKMVANEKVLKGKGLNVLISFTVTVAVKPGGGLFEGTVQYREGTQEYKVTGDISRINKYGDQSKCVEVNKLKKFCFCK